MKRDLYWQLKKIMLIFISVNSVAKPKSIVVFAFTYVLESLTLLYGDLA